MKFGLQYGYFGEYSDGFTTYLNGYEGTTTPDFSIIEDLETLKEEVGEEYEDEYYDEFMRTTDGKIFFSRENAEKHQATLDTTELDELADKINEALIFAEQNRGKSHIFGSVIEVLKKLNGDGGSSMLGKYYDSTC